MGWSCIALYSDHLVASRRVKSCFVSCVLINAYTKSKKSRNRSKLFQATTQNRIKMHAKLNTTSNKIVHLTNQWKQLKYIWHCQSHGRYLVCLSVYVLLACSKHEIGSSIARGKHNQHQHRQYQYHTNRNAHK